MAQDKGSITLRLTPGAARAASDGRPGRRGTLGRRLEFSVRELEERILPGFHNP